MRDINLKKYRPWLLACQQKENTNRQPQQKIPKLSYRIKRTIRHEEKKEIYFKNISCVGKDMEKREPLCTVDGNAEWCSHFGSITEFPQKIKNGSAL